MSWPDINLYCKDNMPTRWFLSFYKFYIDCANRWLCCVFYVCVYVCVYIITMGCVMDRDLYDTNWFLSINRSVRVVKINDPPHGYCNISKKIYILPGFYMLFILIFFECVCYIVFFFWNCNWNILLLIIIIAGIRNQHRMTKSVVSLFFCYFIV